jgi:hypothetical protein
MQAIDDSARPSHRRLFLRPPEPETIFTGKSVFLWKSGPCREPLTLDSLVGERLIHRPASKGLEGTHVTFPKRYAVLPLATEEEHDQMGIAQSD